MAGRFDEPTDIDSSKRSIVGLNTHAICGTIAMLFFSVQILLGLHLTRQKQKSIDAGDAASDKESTFQESTDEEMGSSPSELTLTSSENTDDCTSIPGQSRASIPGGRREARRRSTITVSSSRMAKVVTSSSITTDSSQNTPDEDHQALSIR